MKCELAYLAVLLALTVSGCSGGRSIPAHPKVTDAQIEKYVEADLPRAGPLDAYQKGEIKILDSAYSGDKATIVLTAGSARVVSSVPAGIDLKTEIPPQVISTDMIPWKLRLDYEWVRGEWRLRRSENLTFEKPEKQ